MHLIIYLRFKEPCSHHNADVTNQQPLIIAFSTNKNPKFKSQISGNFVGNTKNERMHECFESQYHTQKPNGTTQQKPSRPRPSTDNTKIHQCQAINSKKPNRNRKNILIVVHGRSSTAIRIWDKNMNRAKAIKEKRRSVINDAERRSKDWVFIRSWGLKKLVHTGLVLPPALVRAVGGERAVVVAVHVAGRSLVSGHGWASCLSVDGDHPLSVFVLLYLARVG